MRESSIELEPFVVSHCQQNPKEVHAEHANLHCQKTESNVAFEMHRDRTDQESKVFD